MPPFRTAVLVDHQHGPPEIGQLAAGPFIIVEQAGEGIAEPGRGLIAAMGQQCAEYDVEPAISELFHVSGCMDWRGGRLALVAAGAGRIGLAQAAQLQGGAFKVIHSLLQGPLQLFRGHLPAVGQRDQPAGLVERIPHQGLYPGHIPLQLIHPSLSFPAWPAGRSARS